MAKRKIFGGAMYDFATSHNTTVMLAAVFCSASGPFFIENAC